MRIVVAIAAEEPFSVRARLLAYGAYAEAAGTPTLIVTVSHNADERAVSLSGHTPRPTASAVDVSALVPEAQDIVVSAAPRVHHIMCSTYGAAVPAFIQLITSGRSVSAIGDHAYAFRLFHKPITRVALSDHLASEIARLMGETDAALPVVVPSIDLEPFAGDGVEKRKSGMAINAFDGDGTGIAADLMRKAGWTGPLRVVDDTMDVQQRAAAYRASLLALIAPQPSEGFCQPAVEAVAAGCQLVMTEGEAASNLPAGLRPAASVERHRPADMANAAQRLLKERSAEGAEHVARARDAVIAWSKASDEAVGVRALVQAAGQLEMV